MKLTKKTVDTDLGGEVRRGRGLFGKAVNRRTFLHHSGVAAGGAALASVAAPRMIKKAHAEGNTPKSDVATEIKLSVCTHCSVGCGVVAEVQDGVWTGQEPSAGTKPLKTLAIKCFRFVKSLVPIRFTGWVLQSSTTNSLICFESSQACGVLTT